MSENTDNALLAVEPQQLEAEPHNSGGDITLNADLRRLGSKGAQIVAGVGQAVQLGRDLLASLDPEEILVATFSPQIREGLKSGKYFLNVRRENGKMLSQAMEVADSGRRQVKEIATLEERKLVPLDVQRNIVDDLANLALQQQLQSIAGQLEEVHQSVRAIEHGQTDDRFGLITGAVNTIRLSLASNDEALLRNALDSLNNGSGIVQKTLERKVSEFEPVPHGYLGRTFKMVTNISRTNYLEKKVREYESIREYFDFYERSQQSIALASYLIGGLPQLREALQIRRNFLASLNLRNVETMKYLVPMLCTEDDWLNHKSQYVASTEESLLGIASSDGSAITVRLTVKQLMEGDKDE